MDAIISENQSAFIAGRQIMDVILIANEIVDEVRIKNKEVIIFKLDFEKAYDSVNWNFLVSVTGRMGFHDKWINWIMECLRSTSISVLVNGSPIKDFKMCRGLRQGDPLSPFLFLIAAEGFSRLMKKAEDKGLYSGYRFQKGADRFTHL